MHAITGRHDGYQFAFFSYMGGGYGGSAQHDGLINGATTISVAMAAGLEIQEQRFPIRYLQYSIREDSEGPGQHRGGPGTRAAIEFLGDKGKVSIMGDRARFAPGGSAGGSSAASADHTMTLGGHQWRPPMGAKAENIPLRRGDVITMQTPGGGGWGPPGQRDRAAVERDVRLGYISQERARKAYGLGTDMPLSDGERQ